MEAEKFAALELKLREAIEVNDLKKVRILLNIGVNPNAQYEVQSFIVYLIGLCLECVSAVYSIFFFIS